MRKRRKKGNFGERMILVSTKAAHGGFKLWRDTGEGPERTQFRFQESTATFLRADCIFLSPRDEICPTKLLLEVNNFSFI